MIGPVGSWPAPTGSSRPVRVVECRSRPAAGASPCWSESASRLAATVGRGVVCEVDAAAEPRVGPRAGMPGWSMACGRTGAVGWKPPGAEERPLAAVLEWRGGAPELGFFSAAASVSGLSSDKTK